MIPRSIAGTRSLAGAALVMLVVLACSPRPPAQTSQHGTSVPANPAATEDTLPSALPPRTAPAKPDLGQVPEHTLLEASLRAAGLEIVGVERTEQDGVETLTVSAAGPERRVDVVYRRLQPGAASASFNAATLIDVRRGCASYRYDPVHVAACVEAPSDEKGKPVDPVSAAEVNMHFLWGPLESWTEKVAGQGAH